MRWQDRRESSNVEDRRQQGSGSGGGGLPLGGKGRLILIVVVMVAGYYGVDLSPLLDEPAQQSQTPRQNVSQPASDPLARFTSVMLASTEDTWGEIFSRSGNQYQPPRLVLYRGATQTGCGQGQSVMGPFYCPADSTVYIDLSSIRTCVTSSGPMATSPRAMWSPTRWATTCSTCSASRPRCASNSRG